VTFQDLLWAPPLLLAIAVVLGTVGRTRADEIGRTIRRRFFELTFGLVLVALLVRGVVTLFA
jgi:hypothetical protein